MDAYLAKHPICASAKNDKGNVNASSVKARIAILRETTPVPEMYAEDYEQLMSLFTLMTKNDEQSKLVKVLKAQLEEKVKEKYTFLTVEEIKELLVNKKWYYSIFDGIDALYVAISHHMTDRIVELAELSLIHIFAANKLVFLLLLFKRQQFFFDGTDQRKGAKAGFRLCSIRTDDLRFAVHLLSLIHIFLC